MSLTTSHPFTGCGTALVTPFRADLSVDEPALRKLIRRQIEAGIDFLVPCGTTGESPTLEEAEHLRIVEITMEEAKGAVPVLAGAGSYATGKLIGLIEKLEALGADGILSVTPYYNKPTQEGLFQHFKAIAQATALPIFVYSVQGRTGVNVEPATLFRLAEIPNIVGVKEASASIPQISRILASAPAGFTVLSGDDVLTLPVLALGGHGLISVASNLIPAEMTRLTQAALQGDFVTARELQRRYHELMDVNFIESNPIPVKYGLAAMGLLDPIYRLPLTPPLPTSKQKIEATLHRVGLLSGAHA